MLRVVLADDERKVIFLLRELIDWDKLGYEIVGVAHDGLRALELVADKQPHLLVTDIRMPGCSGLDLIRQAKERQPGMHCIIISGYREFEYAQSALKYGVEDYLLKPIKKEELTSLLLRLRDKLGEEERQELSRARSEENQQEHLILDLRQAAVQENEPQDSFFSAEEIGERYGLRFPDHGSPEREKNDGAPGSTDKEDKEIKEGKKYKEPGTSGYSGRRRQAGQLPDPAAARRGDHPQEYCRDRGGFRGGRDPGGDRGAHQLFPV